MPSPKGKMSFSNAAYEVLKTERKPLSPKQVIELAIKKGLIVTEGKTPRSSMAARLWAGERFVSAGGGKWELKN